MEEESKMRQWWYFEEKAKIEDSQVEVNHNKNCLVPLMIPNEIAKSVGHGFGTTYIRKESQMYTNMHVKILRR